MSIAAGSFRATTSPASDHRHGGGQTAVYASAGQRVYVPELCAHTALLRNGDIENRHGYLIEKEHAEVDSLLGHGGFFKAKGVGQKLMAGALHTPVSVMETAGEGGPWGMALLASYLVNAEDGETLEDYLDKNISPRQRARPQSPMKPTCRALRSSWSAIRQHCRWRNPQWKR